MFSSFEAHEIKVFQLPPLTYVLWCEKREVSVFSNCQSRVNTVETGKQDPQFKPDVEQEWGREPSRSSEKGLPIYGENNKVL
ncbi:hypothetical protein C0J52_03694 [Blattella germanica]|nr:hypothetical protein C0J52_03694 [Blattella germanica]